MTRSTISPLRRLAATMATLGVLGFGAVAVAPAALADVTPVATVDAGTAAPAAQPAKAPELKLKLPNAKDSGITFAQVLSAVQNSASLPIQSPVPVASVTWDLGGGLKLSLVPQAAQAVQTVAANLYSQAGYQVVFNDNGLLMIGDKICDPSQPKDSVRNKGCKPADGPRF